MLNFVTLTDDKLEKYKYLFNAIQYFNKNGDSLLFLYEYDGTEKVLEINGNVCRSWYYHGSNSIKYDQFIVSDNFDLEYLFLDNSVLIENDDEYFFRNYDTECLEDLEFYSGFKDYQDYDGSVLYSQYNEEKDIRLQLIYQHMTKPDNRIYSNYLKQPFKISIVKNASSNNRVTGKDCELYVRYDFDAVKNYRAFRTATIKDYGLLNTLHTNAVQLQKADRISRYYNVMNIKPNGEFVVSYTFSKQYKPEELMDYIKDLGFSNIVPNYLIEMHNQDNKTYLEVAILLANLKVLNESYRKEHNRSLILNNN